MRITVNMLDEVTPAKFSKAQRANANSLVLALDEYASHPDVQLDLPHRQAHFLCQLFHENGDFKFDRELRNKDGSLTAAQKRYEGRADLGNTQPGDGERFMGRGPIQITGRSNYSQFTRWARAIDPDAPDFVKNPDLVNTDPWEGLTAIWFWSTRKLNQYADANDIEMVTRRINGGVNGLEDRIRYYTRVALVLAGFGPSGVSEFQAAAQKRGLLPPEPGQVDGIDGPKTRAALHKWLAIQAKGTIAADPEIQVTAAPVVQKEETVVVPKGADKPGTDIGAVVTTVAAGGASKYVDTAGKIFGDATPMIQALLIAVAVAAAVYVIWGRAWLAQRTKRLVRQAEERQSDGLPT